jgi:hypothetical protein
VDTRILFFRSWNNARSLAGVIGALKERYTVFEEDPAQPADGKFTPAIDKRVAALLRNYSGKIDFCVTCCHNGNPVMKHLQKEMVVKYGNYDIEHDLYSCLYELSPDGTSLGSFAFTKLQKEYLEKKKRKIFPALWYKYDQSESIPEVTVQIGKTALVVDDLYLGMRDEPFRHFGLFDKVFLKPRAQLDEGKRIAEGCSVKYAEWYGTEAMLTIGKQALFWFSKESSAIVEALFLGRVPVLYFPDTPDREGGFLSEIKEEPLDDVLSRVTIESQFIHGREMLAVTHTGDIAHKIAVLRDNHERREIVIRTLLEQWDIGATRHVKDILVEDIERVLHENSC